MVYIHNFEYYNVQMVYRVRRLLHKGLPALNSFRIFQSFVPKMARSKFEYVKFFETEEKLDPVHWIVISLNCQNHEKLSQAHVFEEPNDLRFLQLMEASAKSIMEDFKELVMGYGFAGEFNFVFPKNTTLYRRRGPKLLTNLCSLMASSFVHKWPSHFRTVALCCPPVIEGAIHLFPNDQVLRDFMTQRQRACHYRNLYNTVYWALILKGGLLSEHATDILKGTSESEQNEILFSKCNMNYNKENDIFKKGSVLLRTTVQTEVTTPGGSVTWRNQSCIVSLYTDFTKNSFWEKTFVLEQPTKVNAKTDYLKDFEKKSRLLLHAWVVVRIDGKCFHRFSEKHNFAKPNDDRSIQLMNEAAHKVMQEFPDIVLSYGQSDEYSFVFDRYSKIMDREGNKIMTNIVSLFAAMYVYKWHSVFGNVALQYSPAFDARVVLYPNNACLRDYLSWRQADCHINNMYNTCFWRLIQSGNYSPKKAEERLQGTYSKDKKSILLNEFELDYDLEDALYRKGTVMYRDVGITSSQLTSDEASQPNTNVQGSISFKAANAVIGKGDPVMYSGTIVTEHIDVIGDQFWTQRPWILGVERCATLSYTDLE